MSVLYQYSHKFSHLSTSYKSLGIALEIYVAVANAQLAVNSMDSLQTITPLLALPQHIASM